MADIHKEVSRREFLKIAGIAGATIGVGAGLGGVLAACGEEKPATTTAAPGGGPATSGAPETSTTAATGTSTSVGPETGREIKIGYVAPLTGMLAVFGVADQYCVDRAKEGFANGVVCGDGKATRSPSLWKMVSRPRTWRQKAGDLINNAKVDLILAASTGTNVGPVADQAGSSRRTVPQHRLSLAELPRPPAGRPEHGFQVDLQRLLGHRRSDRHF